MQQLKKEQGFTMIELIMVIVLLGILAVPAAQILSTAFKSYLTAQAITEANWQGQIAMERMARDIADVASSSSVSTMTSNQFQFIDMSGNSLNYTLSGTNLMSNAQILASGVSSLTFNYYDQNGNTVTTNTNLHVVSISLTITENQSNYNLTTSVYLRDLSL